MNANIYRLHFTRRRAWLSLLSIAIEDGEGLIGSWKLAVGGEPVFKIEPLKEEERDMDIIISAVPQDNFLIEIVTSSGISGTFDVKCLAKAVTVQVYR